MKEASRSNLAIVQIRYSTLHLLKSNITVFSRFYVFWATWFKDQVVEVKILIISLTFDLTTTTTAPTTTQVDIDKMTK